MCHELPHTAPCNASDREEDGRQVGDDEGDAGDVVDDVSISNSPGDNICEVSHHLF